MKRAKGWVTLLQNHFGVAMADRRTPKQDLSPWPTIYRWGTGNGNLPPIWRRIEAGPGHVVKPEHVPGWYPTGPNGEPFRFCEAMERLVRAICQNCEELSHIKADRLMFSVCQARSSDRHGLQARVTPLRFPGGLLEQTRRGTLYQVQRHLVDGVEKLYQVTFCLPRFQNQSFDEKMITIFHELYHIGPKCDGDLRRLGGRFHAHSHSQRHYDAHMAALARFWLATKPDHTLYNFLRLDFRQLQARHGAVMGVFVPRPRLVPVRKSTHS